MKKKLKLGGIDYQGTGKKTNSVEIEWDISEDGQFSMMGAIWNTRHTDWVSGGQIIKEIANLFPNNKIVQRMKIIWERWHLNHLRAGSPTQEKWLRENPIPEAEYRYPKSYYEIASAKLAKVGLNPDNGYKYGSAWLREELPQDVRAEIESWATILEV